LFAGHELESAVGAEVYDSVGVEDFGEKRVERHETVMRRAAARHHQPHWVAFEAECRLDADEDISQRHALDQELAAEGVDCPGRGPPVLFDVTNVRTQA